MVALAKGDGTFGPANLVMRDFSRGTGWSFDNSYPREMGDVNGDKRADLVGFASDGVYIALGKADGTFAPKYKVLSTNGMVRPCFCPACP